MSDPSEYTVAWICALRCESVAAQEFLDAEHHPASYIARHDNNYYTLGNIGHHNVAIAVLPDGEYGTSSAATVARDMLHTFPNIKIGLLVGIGGGAPTAKNDIRLGDAVVSTTQGESGAVFQYDFGKIIQSQVFQHTKHLDKPPLFMRTAVTGCRTEHERKGHSIRRSIEDIIARNDRLRTYSKPAPETDVLYRSDFVHTAGAGPCITYCGRAQDKVIQREQRDHKRHCPFIHYGLIASGDQLMKDARVRDRLASEKGVLCFEMEAAGLMNHFPCLVVRGVCDYSDTHKNDEWHRYAAMTAAAYAADILRRIPKTKVEEQQKIVESINLGQLKCPQKFPGTD